MQKTLLSALLLFIYLGITACGTTGPLYIPEQRYPQETPAETSNDVNPAGTQSTQ